MDLKEIRSLVELMNKNGIAVFKLQREDFKITLKTTEAAQAVVQPVIQQSAPAAPAAPSAPAPTAASVAPAAVSVAPDSLHREICSPMVGTFYAASSPDAEAFVKVGQTVGPDTVVCIIEAMKVMNEIKAELAGTITEICVENGKPVQFGQPLFRVK